MNATGFLKKKKMREDWYLFYLTSLVFLGQDRKKTIHRANNYQSL
jgi:hypothetical protein